MRDEPLDAEIPNEFKPNNYYAHRLANLKAELAELKKLTAEQCKKRADSEYNTTIQYAKREKQKNVELLKKYNAMLAEVINWVPPTSEHDNLKNS